MTANASASTAEMGLRFFGQITAGVTHEIKNHLALINEFNGLLGDLILAHERGQPLNLERIKSLSQDVKRQVSLGGQVVGNLNRFAHSVDQAWEETDLASQLKLFVLLNARPAGLKGVSIELALPPDPAPARTRPFYLLLALQLGLQALLEQAPRGSCLILSLHSEPERAKVLLAPGGAEAWPFPAQAVPQELAQALGAETGASAEGLYLILPRQGA